MVFAICLLLLSIVLLCLELFIPSAGLLSVAAVISTIGWIVAAFVYGGTTMGALAMVVTAVIFPVAFVVATRIWPKTTLGRAVLIGDAAHDHQRASRWTEERTQLVGRHGKTISPMRPSGAIEVDGRQFDAVTEGRPLSAQTEITVISFLGNSLVVIPRIVDPTGEFPAAAASSAEPSTAELERQIPDPFDDPLG